MVKKALVFSGGGAAGGAWMLGLINALREEGVDLGDADLMIGTSAGARVGAQLATGVTDQVADMIRRSELPSVEVYAKLPEFVLAVMRVMADAPSELEAVRRIANLGPIGKQLASAADRREMVAAQLPSPRWPQRRLLITAVDADSGMRVTFDADSGVDLLDAVTASGALPGIYPLVTINGRRYADGGVHSVYNADLAVGHDVVVVITPAPLNSLLKPKLDAEVAALGPATVHLVTPDEKSIAAIGPDANDAATAPAALEAAGVQARRELSKLTSVWRSASA
jgi:NTE family protein